MDKIVFHIDVNSAFLSWSAAYRVNVLGEKYDLRDIPSVIGGDQEKRHGIVLAKSMSAKKFGISTGEAIMTARQKCPNLVVVPPDYHLYVAASRALIDFLKEYSDQVEQYSIDEAWAEFTGFHFIYGNMVVFANELKNRIQEKFGFTVNIGISSNRLLAKMAGELKKPNMVHTLFPNEIQHKMWPLPVNELFFVGKSTQKKLYQLGIHTIGDLANADISVLKAHLKKHGELIWNYANGRELIPYMYAREEKKGYGNSTTAPADITNSAFAKKILLSLSETVAMRIREDGVKIALVSVSLTSTSFNHNSKQRNLISPTCTTEEIYQAACQIFDSLWDGVTPIRQIGVNTGKISYDSYHQYHLFEQTDHERLARMNHAVDAIRVKYGEDAIFRASFLDGNVSHMGGGLHKERRTGVTVGIDLQNENKD